MILKVDYREKKLIPLLNAKLEELKFKNINIEICDLPLGDVILCDDNGDEMLIIERKTLNDLAASIRDGRYKEQSYRLDNHEVHNHNIVYLIEGDIHRYSSRYNKISAKTLNVTMFCINYFKGFSLMKTRDILETAEYILIIADKFQREKVRKNYYYNKNCTVGVSDVSNNVLNEVIKVKEELKSTEPVYEKRYSEVIHKVKKKNIRPDNIGEIILSQIPGISGKTSVAIMNEFSSLYDLIQQIQKDDNCLEKIRISTSCGKRKISQNIIRNLKKYLLYNKDSVIIKIDT